MPPETRAFVSNSTNPTCLSNLWNQYQYYIPEEIIGYYKHWTDYKYQINFSFYEEKSKKVLEIE